MSWSSMEKLLLVLIIISAAVVFQSHQLVDACIEEERLALLHLHAYFKSHNNDTLYEIEWPGHGERFNCCTWDRVYCSPSTGRVIELQLDSPVITGQNNHWMFNVTVFRPFKQLITLDLSAISINGLVEHDDSTTISSLKNLHSLFLDGNYYLQPSYVNVGALTSLRTLSLQQCYLKQSIVGIGLSNLTHLQELNLFDNNLEGEIDGITNMKQFKFLDLSGNQFNGSIQGICELRNLQQLSLEYNLFHEGVPLCLSNLTSLQLIDISYNQFKGVFPHWLSNHTLLESLSLAGNYFQGQFYLSSMANLSNLHTLDLSRSGLEVQTEDSHWQPKFQLQELGLEDCNLNKPHGILPNFLRNQYNLTYIDLSNNNLTRIFPSWLLYNNSKIELLYMENNSLSGSLLLPSNPRPSLQYLMISSNHIQGKISENIGSIFPNLRILNISRNHFYGHIPISITHMSTLLWLDVSSNNFSGELPRGLFNHCVSLRLLILSDNHLQGKIIPEHMNLTNLRILEASNNRFDGTIKGSIKRSPGLAYLDISNNNMTGNLYGWIRNLTQLEVMLLSKNNLQGHIPRDICNLKLQYLDLSHNNFIGFLPTCLNFSSLISLHLNKNNFRGSIPNSLLSGSSMIEIDMRDNFFSGNIPSLINKFSTLKVLQLGGNNLDGQIPHQICQLVNLDILDLSRNQLYGGLPTCLGNMSFGLRGTENYGSMLFSYEFTDIYGNVLNIQDVVEVVAKNQYYSYASGDHLVMSALDLSCNNLSGVVPQELGDFGKIHSVNLSHNHLFGSIPNSFSNLKEVESLDLSYNHLSGSIPSQLIELHSLEVFNVSYNNLSGRTPETEQFATFDESSYLGNSGLCGFAVKSCQQTSVLTPKPKNEDKSFYMEDFLWCFGMTTFIAFMATVAILSINPYWRTSWFDFVEWHFLWWML